MQGDPVVVVFHFIAEECGAVIEVDDRHVQVPVVVVISKGGSTARLCNRKII